MSERDGAIASAFYFEAVFAIEKTGKKAVSTPAEFF